MVFSHFEIVDINLKMPFQDFERELQDIVDNYSEPMTFNIKQLRTRLGKAMYKLIVENDSSDNINIVAECDDVNGDIYFHPLKLSNMNESFFTSSVDTNTRGQLNDPCYFIYSAFSELARNHKATFACIEPISNYSYSALIVDGKTKRVDGIGLVDSDGKMYSIAGAKMIKGDANDTDFSIRQPINEWIQEHRDIQQAIAHLPLNEKMDYIGKWLIQARLKDEIDSDEFVDIFRQAGLFGFTETSVQNIYKLIM